MICSATSPSLRTKQVSSPWRKALCHGEDIVEHTAVMAKELILIHAANLGKKE